VAVKAIIFDIDGVLADSREAVVHNTKALLEEFGFAVPKSKVEAMSSAHSAESVLLSLVPKLEGDRALLSRMLARLSALTAENLHMVKPLGLAEKIPQLAKKYRLAVATNRKSSARMVLGRLGIAGFFNAVLTSADAPPKPSPQMLLAACKRLGVEPGEAIFVGDNEEDRLAGEAAGTKTFLLNKKGSWRRFLKEFL